jgi:colanic acid/amylovoran biosynthesis glycosyltransferase
VQAGRLIPKKGYEAALRAFARFAATRPNALFWIAGEGEDRVRLEGMARSLGVAGQVHFEGFLTQEALFQRFQRAHMLLHPSETGADGNVEGVPNAMLEAMATGLPVIATRHGGIPEAVDDGVSGYLLDEGDSEGLCAAMERLATGGDTVLARFGAAARRSVEDRFGTRASVDCLESIYGELLELRPAQIGA